jgi:hypothetical protein
MRLELLLQLGLDLELEAWRWQRLLGLLVLPEQLQVLLAVPRKLLGQSHAELVLPRSEVLL